VINRDSLESIWPKYKEKYCIIANTNAMKLLKMKEMNFNGCLSRNSSR